MADPSTEKRKEEQVNLRQTRKLVDGLLEKQRSVHKLVAEEFASLCRAEDNFTHCEQAQQVIQHVVQTVQQTAHKQIAEVVSKCLQTVFEEPYEFVIRFERRRGKTEAELVFVRDGIEVQPIDAAGGGVVDLAGFALRLACLILSRPRRRKVLVLDEPFKFVHGDKNRQRVRQLLLSLAKEFDVQFIISTGIPEYHIGKVVDLT